MNSQINSEGNIILHFDTRQGLRIKCDTLISSLKAVKAMANFVSQGCFGKECTVNLETVCFEEGSFKVTVKVILVVAAIWHNANNSLREISRFSNSPLSANIF